VYLKKIFRGRSPRTPRGGGGERKGREGRPGRGTKGRRREEGKGGKGGEGDTGGQGRDWAPPMFDTDRRPWELACNPRKFCENLNVKSCILVIADLRVNHVCITLNLSVHKRPLTVTQSYLLQTQLRQYMPTAQ
jgi:hypothetical protein